MDYFDYVSNLMFLEEQNFQGFSNFVELTVPQLLSSETADAVAPFPGSLCEFDDLWSHSSSDLVSEDHPSALVSYNYHSESQSKEVISLDDIDLDFFRSNDTAGLIATNNEEVISDTIALNLAGMHQHKSSSTIAVAIPENGAGARIWTQKKRTPERRAAINGRSRSNDISLEEMRNYFEMPITRAAKEMNVGLTVLKKRCRELGISRWPHRKMKSLKSLIHNVQGLSTEERVRKEVVEQLEKHKRMMEENPEMQLSERTKKLRQACFKANYKKRRSLSQYSAPMVI